MLIKLIGSIAVAGMVSTSAMAAGPDAVASGTASAGTLTLTELCAHARLSPADQADCSTRSQAATTEIQRLEVRRLFEAKAGLRAGSMSGASGTSGTAPQVSGPSAGDPLTAPAAKPKID